jgi:hypothetical protein
MIGLLVWPLVALAVTATQAVDSLSPSLTRSFVYKKTKQADLEIVVHYPSDWKETGKRPAIVFFFGGGRTGGRIQQFEPQATLQRAGRVAVEQPSDARVAEAGQQVFPTQHRREQADVFLPCRIETGVAAAVHPTRLGQPRPLAAPAELDRATGLLETEHGQQPFRVTTITSDPVDQAFLVVLALEITVRRAGLRGHLLSVLGQLLRHPLDLGQGVLSRDPQTPVDEGIQVFAPPKGR